MTQLRICIEDHNGRVCDGTGSPHGREPYRIWVTSSAAADGLYHANCLRLVCGPARLVSCRFGSVRSIRRRCHTGCPRTTRWRVGAAVRIRDSLSRSRVVRRSSGAVENADRDRIGVLIDYLPPG